MVFTTTTTVLTNPGIINRLELDINEYPLHWGFRIERLISGNHAASNNAVFHTPPLQQHDHKPLGTLHLRVLDEKLISTVGPLLRTYVRLSHSVTSPMRFKAIVDCDFIMIVNIDDEVDVAKSIARRMQREEHEDNKNNEKETGEYLSSSEIAASRMAHHVHVIVRNSMGSALCLDLFVILPRYRVRIRDETTTKIDGQQQEEEEEKKHDDDTKIMSLSSRSVELAMQRNPDACYPSIRVVDCHRAGIQSFDTMAAAATTLVLEVRTRMCTVLHSPLVFKWLHSLSSWPTNEHNSLSASDLSEPIVRRGDEDTKAALPIVVACIEKVANLHRLLMLCHSLDINLLSNIVVVLPNVVADGRRKDEIRLRQFVDAVDNFYKVVVVNSDRGNVKCHHMPIILHEDRALEVIADMMIERSHAMSTSSAIVPCSELQSMVGIDLHPSALILDGNYITTSPALRKLRNADAIVFGYESTGIPDVLTTPLNDWVQIPSRSSINVIAAMSIIFDALFA